MTEFTLWYVGAVITAEVLATLNIHLLHWWLGAKVDHQALWSALGLVTGVALVGYGAILWFAQ